MTETLSIKDDKACGPDRGIRDEMSLHRETLIGVAYRILGEREQAEDAVQDVYLSMLQNPDRFAGASGLKTYLYRMVINRSIDLRRRRGRFGGILEKVMGDSLFTTRPHDVYEVKEIVRRLVHSLDPQFAVPFILAEVEGMSYEEIAEIRGMPLNTVRTRIYRCREKLRKKLSEMGYP